MAERYSCGFIPRESGKTRSIGYGVEVLPTMNADGNYAVLVLNDQGGGIMNISYDVVHTLRAQTKHHEPIILNRLSYGLEPGAATRLNWENRIHKELTPTLRQNMGDNQISVIVLENRKNDRLQKNGSPDPQGRVSRMGRNGSV